MSKPVQVYILMGQSNMLGFGNAGGLADACKNKGLYPYLIDEAGDWTVRKDVRFVRVMCSGSGPSKTYNNEWMTIKGNIGPEMGIGHYVGHATKAPVMILKSCIGNRSLGYDLLPPSAEGYAGDPNPAKRPTSGPWYAGVQYDGDIAAAKQVLKELRKHYPGAGKYEVAGFFWWQGDKDFRNVEHAANYEKNLLCLIKSLREDFDSPNAKFVCATLGQTKKGAGGAQGQILEATLNMDGERGKYRDHRGKVASVYSHPLSKGGGSSGHYGGNAETYMNIGQAMGKAMAKLIMNSPGSVPGIDVDELDSPLKRVYKCLVSGKLNEADKSLRPYLAAAGSKKEEQVVHARELNDYLAILVEGSIEAMHGFRESGDFCQLRDELAKNDKSHSGIPAYDSQKETWAADLTTEKAIRAIAIGDKLSAIFAKKERTSPAKFFGLVNDFQKEHPDSFYASRAEAEIAPVRAAIRKVFEEVSALEKLGDLYSKFETIKESRSRFARIPEFDEANERWVAEAKDPGVRKSIAAGKAYLAVFADLAKLNDQLESSSAKNNKITRPSKRAKAEERTMASHLRKLKALAGKLEKLADKHAGGYYGRAARASFQAYTDSKGQTLTDQREK
ncbi:MAG TPA: hypothetical protein EYQ25_12290 [Planctomycetes bacterium]|nr:hypothetical protein [Planctomycetota bacterium]